MVLPNTVASRPTKISKDGKVMPPLKLHDRAAASALLTQGLSENTALTAEILNDFGIDGAVTGQMAYAVEQILEGSEDAEGLFDQLAAEAAEAAAASSAFWSFYEEGDDGRAGY